MTTKLQTMDITRITVTTGDNVPLEVAANVNWLVEDVTLAARMAANTMTGSQSQPNNQFDLTKLRQDVERQVTASIAAFVGSISYSSQGHGSMAAQVEGKAVSAQDTGLKEPDPEEMDGAKALFNRDKLNGSVQHANDICRQYGVKILSINLISAYPSDRSLLEALSKGAVATVAAEQTETAARGEAKALLLKAKAEAESERIRAEGHAAAEEICAEGSLKAAKQLENSEVATMIAKLRASGQCLSDAGANSFFFGLGGPGDVPSGMLGNGLLAEAAASRAR